MAELYFAEGRGRPDFRGLDSLFEFTNEDGALVRTNCGQAAAATLLTHHGKLGGTERPAQEIMGTLERAFPPDQLFGLFGTGRKRVERICRAHELPLVAVQGKEALKECLCQRRPVIVMLGVSAGRLLGRMDLPGGHWMVAFGFDAENVYLTNCGPMPWPDFHRGWRAPVARLIGMNSRGLTAQQ